MAHRKAMLLAAAAGSLIAQTGYAQESEGAPAQAQAPQDKQVAQTQHLEAAPGEIIVTARKRDERAMDVPVAISALSGESLQRYATNSLTAISERIPQLIIGESTNQTGGSINLRGIGAGIANPSTEQAVTLNLDGIPISYGNAVRLGQYDLQRVEVLKGPQALFYGKNSPGGIISLISADPGQSFEARLRTGYEFEADQRFVEGIVSGPLTDQIGARVVAYYSKEDGWFRNIGVPVAGRTPGAAASSNNAEELFLRGTLTFRSSDDRLHLKVKVNYGKRDRDGIGPAAAGQPVYCPYGAAQIGLGVTTDCKLDRYFTDVALPASVAALHPSFGDGIPYSKSRQFLGSLTGDLDLTDALTLSMVTGYYRLQEESLDSFTSVNNPATGASNDLVAKAFSEEVRLASNYDGPVNFLVGGFVQDARFTVDQAFYTFTAAPALIAATAYDQKTLAYSMFGQVRVDITDQLELAAGARQSWEDKSLKGTVNETPFTILNPSRNYHDFSPEVTLTYKPATNLTIYGAYREGFTSGGFNTLPTPLRSPAFPSLPARDLSFDQMTARGGEGGIKGFIAGRQIGFDLIGYWYKYKGLQLSRWDPVAFSQTVQNAGAARVRGIEFSATARPDALPGFEWRGAASFNDAKYTDFIGGCYGGQSIAAGCNLDPRYPGLDPSTFGTAANPYTAQDQTGQRLARAPKWALSSGFTYDHEIAGSMSGTVSFDALYTSAYAYQTEANPKAVQSAYWLLNGSLGLYGGADRAWELSLIGRNLTNKLYTATGGTLAFTGTGTGTNVTTAADLLGVPGSPRSVLLQLTLRSSLLGH
ncbi:TonB-dependent receptor [Novosphingobium sp. ST904]|uniref:TonB-dependent receptor n=1 Tax=Novosphingobium sp. ST904 TaxID=1684385 RepID=UPI000ADC3177|nr:TonB-dependent receptor [Novosphingobium sp. ST904]TCM27775.1 outer membrane receptor protein involved in Fe transport [Novosphingobium sp. ST904]